MRKYLLPKEGNFYKGNMHCHSNWSDGFYSPEELKKLYMEKGYSVLSITDHEGLFYHKKLNEENKFLTIAGCELAFNQVHGEDYNDWIVSHINVYKKDISEIYQLGYNFDYTHPKFGYLKDKEKVALINSKGDVISKEYSVENINDIVKRYRDSGFLVTFNHPDWSKEAYETYMKYENFNCMEIFNTGAYNDGIEDNNEYVYDYMLSKGKKLYCVAADDNHRSLVDKRCDMFGGFTMFKAESLTYENIIDAFENGNFYSSQGPEIESLYVEDGFIYVKTKTPAKSIRFVTGCRYAALNYDKSGEDIFESRFKLFGDYKYVRVEVKDAFGKKAYTNAYFADELEGSVL